MDITVSCRQWRRQDFVRGGARNIGTCQVMSSVEICSFKYVKTFIFSTLIRSAGMDHDYTYWSLAITVA